MGELRGVVQKRGAQLIGIWPTEGYEFKESQGLYDESHFLGLGLDEVNEPDLTKDRVRAWLLQIVTELGFDVSATE